MFIKRKNYKQAVNAYRNTLNLSKGKLNNKIYISVAWMYICKDNYDKAINLCLKFEEQENKSLRNNYLGFAYCKKGDPKKGLKLIRSSIQLDKNYCHAWINLAKIELELKNYYKSFIACFRCLQINNQYKEALDFYRTLQNTIEIKTLSKIVPLINKLGYIPYLGPFECDGTAYKEIRYIRYSRAFIYFLSTVTSSNKFLTIYAWFPKCERCDKPITIKNDIINHKINVEFVFYVCKACGTREKVMNHRETEFVPYIKIHIVVKPSVETPEPLHLIHERLHITFSKADSISRKLQSRLEKTVKLFDTSKDDYDGKDFSFL